jgi:hypothetical protein
MKDAVEYILSPFWALEFTNHSTSTLEDLSSYKCVIWCQDISAIPSTLLLHIPSEKHSYYSDSPQQLCKKMFTYHVKVEARELKYDDSLSNQYEETKAILNYSGTDRDFETDCYFPPSLCSLCLIQKYSTSVVFTCWSDQIYYSALELKRALQISYCAVAYVGRLHSRTSKTFKS